MRVRVFLSVRNHPVGILLRIFTTHSYTLEFPSLASRHTQFGYSLHAQAHAHKRKFFVTFASDEYVFCTRSILFVFLSHLFYFPFFTHIFRHQVDSGWLLKSTYFTSRSLKFMKSNWSHLQGTCTQREREREKNTLTHTISCIVYFRLIEWFKKKTNLTVYSFVFQFILYLFFFCLRLEQLGCWQFFFFHFIRNKLNSGFI